MADNTLHGERQPLRDLDPVVASAIYEAKQRSGRTWRQLAGDMGMSHSFLHQLGAGVRVPSDVTAEKLIDVLPLDRTAARRLREVAVTRLGGRVVDTSR